ncbi:MAG TPA: hypothetical protein PKO28_02635 [Bacilli bacterium]|nr:hypothetical protein [Bacilli bacterium]
MKHLEKDVFVLKIYVDRMHPDGMCFEGKEGHLWMPIQGFGGLKSDYISFFVEVYRYAKKQVIVRF